MANSCPARGPAFCGENRIAAIATMPNVMHVLRKVPKQFRRTNRHDCTKACITNHPIPSKALKSRNNKNLPIHLAHWRHRLFIKLGDPVCHLIDCASDLLAVHSSVPATHSDGELCRFVQCAPYTVVLRERDKD